MLLFAAFRTAFLVIYSDALAGLGWFDMVEAYLVGSRFDMVIVLFILLPLILVLPWVDIRRRGVRTATCIYLAVTASSACALLLIDLRFFAHFGSRLSFLAYEYLGHPGAVWDLVASDRWLAPSILIWIGLSVGIGWGLLRLIGGVARMRHRPPWSARIGWFVVLLGLAVLGIRGRVGLSPLDWGVAYFSDNHVLNQSALNGVYTLARNYTEDDGDMRLSNLAENERYPFVALGEAIDTVRSLLHQPADVWLDSGLSVRRTTIQPEAPRGYPPNVVFVIMESWSAANTGCLGSPHDLTPRFDSLARHGLLLENFYANGIRTSFGLPAVLGGFPALPGRSIMGRYDAVHPFRAISEVLAERHYTNVFIYGGDLVFDNMQGFFKAKQYHRFYGEEELGIEHGFSKWGIPDHIMFELASDIIDSLPRPFHATILTLSNHEPWDLPDSSRRRYFDDADTSRLYNAQLYADWSLGCFFDEISKRPVFDSTIFVLTADHARFGIGRYPMDPAHFRIPLLILGSGVPDSAQVVPICGSQVDILPTLMGLLGGSYEHASWGRDLLRLGSDDTGLAWMTAHDRIGLIAANRFYLEWLGRSQALYDATALDEKRVLGDQNNPEALQPWQTWTRHYYQAAEQLRLTTPELPGDLK